MIDQYVELVDATIMLSFKMKIYSDTTVSKQLEYNMTFHFMCILYERNIRWQQKIGLLI